MVIGGGLLGLEAARGLLSHGVAVTVVHLATHVMDAQLDAPGGRVLQRQLEIMGLRVLTGCTTHAVLGDGKVEGLAFSDGSELSCDLLVVAAGVRPNIELARASALRTNRGIVVGDDLSCVGAPNIYALGDCAEHEGRSVRPGGTGVGTGRRARGPAHRPPADGALQGLSAGDQAEGGRG